MSTPSWENEVISDDYLSDFIRKIRTITDLTRDMAGNQPFVIAPLNAIIERLQPHLLAESPHRLSFGQLTKMTVGALNEAHTPPALATNIIQTIQDVFKESHALETKNSALIEEIKTEKRLALMSLAKLQSAERGTPFSRGIAAILLVEENKWDIRTDKSPAPSDVFHNDLVNYLRGQLDASLKTETPHITGKTGIANLVEVTLHSVSQTMRIPYKGRGSDFN